MKRKRKRGKRMGQRWRNEDMRRKKYPRALL